jgi:hypothetical protein
MLMSVTNLQSAEMNGLDTHLSGVQGTPSSMAATGGARKDPLPYPFNRSGAIAAGATKTLPVRSRDFVRQNTPFEPLAPADEWQQLIQAGKISVLLTAEQAQALLLTGVDANGGIKVTAKRQGVRIKLANGGAEAIAVSGLDITATLNSGTSTASTTKTLIDGSTSAAALVSIAVTGSGAGVISDSTTFKQVPYAESDLQDKLISGL